MADLYFKVNFNLQHGEDDREKQELLDRLHKLKNHAESNVDDDANGLAFVSGDDWTFPADVEQELKTIQRHMLIDSWPWEVAIVPEEGDPI